MRLCITCTPPYTCKPYNRPDSKRFFAQLSFVLHKIICCGYLLESPPRGDSNRSPQYMFEWRNFHFFSFTTNLRFPQFVLSARCESGVTFVWRCFRDEISAKPPLRKHRKRLVCLKGPSLGNVRVPSLVRQVPLLQLRTSRQ